VNSEHHILTDDQGETLCGVKFMDLPPGTPIITLFGYRRGTKLSIHDACVKAESETPEEERATYMAKMGRSGN
jgi:hypothetical protein